MGREPSAHIDFDAGSARDVIKVGSDLCASADTTTEPAFGPSTVVSNPTFRSESLSTEGMLVTQGSAPGDGSDFPGTGLCEGDSGGPLFRAELGVNGEERVLAINTGTVHRDAPFWEVWAPGDATVRYDFHLRLDAHEAWLRNLLPESSFYRE